jgi:hypothetical protein
MLQNLAATASHLHVRDDRETPLCMRRDARQMQLIWGEDKAGYLSRQGWTGGIGLIRLVKLVFGRGGIWLRSGAGKCAGGGELSKADLPNPMRSVN